MALGDYIINDIKIINQKKNNDKLNRAIQAFLFTIVTEEVTTVCMYVCMYVCMDIWLRQHVSVYVYVYMYVRVYRDKLSPMYVCMS